MLNISAFLLNRIGTMLALKALPDQAALHAYMRSMFKGIACLVVGSVLLGAAITASIYVVYDQMIAVGYERVNALFIAFGLAMILIIICFLLADKWLSERFGAARQVRSVIDQKLDHVRDVAGDTITGFIEGLLETNKQQSRKRR